jgi:hypothetical protein
VNVNAGALGYGWSDRSLARHATRTIAVWIMGATRTKVPRQRPPTIEATKGEPQKLVEAPMIHECRQASLKDYRQLEKKEREERENIP